VLSSPLFVAPGGMGNQSNKVKSMTRDVRDINDMRALVAGGENLHDVVFHYKCPVSGKRKKITLAYDVREDGSTENGARMFVGDKTRLDVVLEGDGKSVRTLIDEGKVAYKG